jgi:uncharacterized protein YgbK (DUF1537 family)
VTRLRILADDLTGALDCAAAFGAGVPVHLARPGEGDPDGVDIVATATRDVPAPILPGLLHPCIDWLRAADVAFKKVDSLLRGNTFDEIDWLARAGGWRGLVLAPAFPAQGRTSRAGQQWLERAGAPREAVSDMAHALRGRGWAVQCGGALPVAGIEPVAWLPDVAGEPDLAEVARQAGTAGDRAWLWCGSAGLAGALAQCLALPAQQGSAHSPRNGDGVLLVSASRHAVTREQWQALRAASAPATCHHGEDPASLATDASSYPRCIDLCASGRMDAGAAAALLARQAQAIARHAPRPGTLVVVGGDTLLALCAALGTRGLVSLQPLPRPGWGCARMVGGAWDGVTCHTRSGAFGGPQDLCEVLALLPGSRPSPG